MSDSGGILTFVIYLAVLLFFVYVGWRIFTKADQPGWAAIIPIYNVVVTLRIIGRPAWWLLLLLIPIVQIYPLIMIPIDLADSFGKGTGFGIGLLLLGPIFYPILAFGDAEYQGPSTADGTAPATA